MGWAYSLPRFVSMKQFYFAYSNILHTNETKEDSISSPEQERSKYYGK